MASNKKAGKKSLAQNDFLAPAAPQNNGATDVGIGRAYGNGAAIVSFIPTGPNAATSYTVRAYNNSNQLLATTTGTSSPITVSGLMNDYYYFTVSATNGYGESPESDPTPTLLVTTVPKKPEFTSATSPTAGVDRIEWSAPLNGSKTITNYHWASDDGKSGDTTNTYVEISQEQGTAQTYTVYATNENGNSVTSDPSASVTTTFSFVPFGAFGFSPFGAFGFSPFGAFGFSPFGAFGFSPFGFSPFGAFGFSPFGFSPFGFSPYAPRCIAGDTKIATVGEDGEVVWVEAKHIKVGDKVFSPVWDEFDGTPSPYESRIEYPSMTNMRVGIGEIEYILEKNVEESIIFNDDIEKHFSTTQPILARKQGGVDAWEFTKDIAAGDIIWEYDFESGEYKETTILDANVIKTPNDVFQIGVKGIDTFIAGGVVSHNK